MFKKVIFSGLVVGVMTATAFFQKSFAQVTPQQVAEMQTVIGSTISDNGKYVAYTVAIPADPIKENNRAVAHLYVLNTQTGVSKVYYTSSSASQVKFRPNTNKVSFVTRKAGDKTNSLYEIDMEGGEAQKIFSPSVNMVNYAWHPNGNTIAFVGTKKGEEPKSSLAYSPDFYEESYNERNGYIADLSSADKKENKINVNGAVYMLSWSPTGNKLAISVAPTASVDDSYMEQAVKVVDPNNRNIIAEINNKGKLGDIVWSPNESQLALLSANDLYDPISGRILLVSAQGGEPKIIDKDYLGRYESIDWVAANKIYFHSSEGAATTIGTITPDGSKKDYIFKSNQHRITSFSRNNKGNISFVANTPTHPSEVFTMNEKKKNVAQKRTDHNPWLKGVKLGKQEVVTYKARDGKYEIEGMLIYPIDYKEGTRYPLITVVHGGPESHYSNGWLTAYSMPGQMGAAKGYAVFYPNYRGSTGRGIEFAYSSQNDPAGKEFDDVVDGVDYLIEKGIVDKNRVGVTGGSYGGYASAWMSTYYSDRFAAAVMFVGISNLISKFGTSDIPNELYLVHSRSRLWDNWQKELERSPIYYVERSQTPILIMHGADDPRVHPAQSMELYRHIKVRKPEVPLRLIYYPGEGHGNARSGSRYDYNLRMLEWFDTYLKTGNRTAPKPNLDLPE